jgi:acyl-CoA thioesterase-2
VLRSQALNDTSADQEEHVGDFGIDTRVEGGQGRYTAKLSEDWRIWGPNGGYVATIALRAIGAEAAIKRPTSIHVHYLRVAEFGAVDVQVTPLAQGRRAESFRAAVTQGGKPIIEAMVRTAAEGDGLTHDDARPAGAPLPESLPTRAELRAKAEAAGAKPPSPYNFWSNFDEIRCIDLERYSDKRAAAAPRFREWYKLRCAEGFGDPFLDAGRSLLMIDTLTWPSAVQAHVDPTFIAPSLDVSVWFHARSPDDPWLLADGHSPIGAGGVIGTHGATYDRSGRLLATGGGQLLCVPAPPR